MHSDDPRGDRSEVWTRSQLSTKEDICGDLVQGAAWGKALGGTEQFSGVTHMIVGDVTA